MPYGAVLSSSIEPNFMEQLNAMPFSMAFRCIRSKEINSSEWVLRELVQLSNDTCQLFAQISFTSRPHVSAAALVLDCPKSADVVRHQVPSSS